MSELTGLETISIEELEEILIKTESGKQRNSRGRIITTKDGDKK